MISRLAALTGLLTCCLLGCGGAATPLVVPTAAAPATSPAASHSVAPAVIEVYVTGAVARPGVYSLPAGSRVQDAIAAAGGFVDGADMVRVNLAARLRDEEEIVVPQAGQPQASLLASGLDINSATATQLRTTLGLSSSLASKIVAYRRAHGPFSSVDDLRDVPVPDSELERIRPQVTVR